jgi:hypothetical protein
MKELGAALAQQWKSQPETLLIIAAGAFALLALITVGLLVAVVVMARRQARLLRGTSGGNLENALRQQMDSAEETERRVERSLRMAEGNADGIRSCLQRVGVVRFDAFADSGGEQSFVVALMDAGGNGVLLTGIHSRQDFRVYAKPVISGDSPVALTAEERRAIATAATPAEASALSGGTAGRGGKERR